MASANALGSIGRHEPATWDGSPSAGEGRLTNDTSPGFVGWEGYPQSLKANSRFTKNLLFHSQRLDSEAKKLFCKPEEALVEVLACAVPVSCTTDEMRFDASNEETLERILIEKEKMPFRTFTITQAHSWSELEITREMLRKLFSFLQVFPEFLNVVHLFGRRTQEPYSSSSGFNYKIRGSAGSPTSYSELCFNLFYVELNEREGAQDPWSLRQTGFYLKSDFKHPSSTHIFIQPSESVDELVEEAILNGNISEGNPLPLQLAFLTAAMENWSDYIAFLEGELKKFRECVNLSDSDWDAFRKNGAGKINYSDYRKLQRYLRDKVLRTMSVLDSNIDVIVGLQKFNSQLRKQRLIPYDDTFRESCEILEGHQRGIRNLRRSLGSILQVVDGSIKLVKTLIDIRNDAIIQDYSNATRGLLAAAQDSRREAVEMVEIAQRTKRDSRTMRIITVVAMMYLPGTFVATFFGMNIVHSELPADSVAGFLVSKEIWIFVIVTIALTGVTIGSWWFSERYLGSREAAKVEVEVESLPSPTLSTASTLRSRGR